MINDVYYKYNYDDHDEDYDDEIDGDVNGGVGDGDDNDGLDIVEDDRSDDDEDGHDRSDLPTQVAGSGIMLRPGSIKVTPYPYHDPSHSGWMVMIIIISSMWLFSGIWSARWRCQTGSSAWQPKFSEEVATVEILEADRELRASEGGIAG